MPKKKNDYEFSLGHYLAANHQLPQNLYHYTNRSGLVGICGEGALHCHEYRALNDRTEVGHFATMVQEQFAARLPDLVGQEDTDFILQGMILLSVWNVFVCSFATAGDSNFHWQAYGRQHAVALEFDGPIMLGSARHQGFSFGPVIYSEDQARAVAKAAFEDSIASIQKLPKPLSLASKNSIGHRIFRIILTLGAFFKSSSFDKEDEWRIVRVGTNDDDRKLRFKPNDEHFLVPYVGFDLRKNRYDLSSRKSGSMFTGLVLGPSTRSEIPASHFVYVSLKNSGFADATVRSSKSSLRF